jgi:hypothetical protein
MKVFPIIVMICLSFGSLCMAAVKHGESRDDYNGWISLVAFILVMLLYWWAGLFTVFAQ